MQTAKSVQALEVVLREYIENGKTIFQGRSASLPLETILARAGSPYSAQFVDLQGHNKVFEYCKEDQVISVETGMTLAELNEILSPNGQYLPLFANQELSILDIINSGDTGYPEHNFGLRSLVLGLEIALAGGEQIKTGGKVVKNVSGYDLTKLFLGSRGTLGLPLKAHLRVYATFEQTELLVAHGLSPDALLSLASKLMQSGLPLAGLEYVIGNKLSFVDNLPNNFLLVVISEHRDVMSELLPLLNDLFEQSGAEVTRLDSQLHRITLESITNSFRWNTDQLAASVSRSQLKALLPFLTNYGDFKLLYRPGSGRLNISFSGAQQLTQMRAGLAEFALVHDTNNSAGLADLDVAFADDRFEYRVERIGGKGEELFKIKQQIKQKFDPQNKLNPLAKM